MWMSEASAAIASSIEEVDEPDDRRLEGHVAEVVDVLVAVAAVAARPPMPSTILCSAVLRRRRCARWPRGWPAAGATHELDRQPEASAAGRRADGGLGGSAVATVSDAALDGDRAGHVLAQVLGRERS